MMRRSVDIVFSLVALAIGLPFLLPIAVLIKLGSSGPVFYVSQRTGKNGRSFSMYKLRSMTHQPVDRRITRMGHLLRWIRIDEYPQFYNVLRGDMSLFGPRPLTLEDAKTIQLTVRPGVVPWFSH